MTLHPDWKKILTKAWSIRFLILAGILSGLEVGLPLLAEVVDIPTGVFAALSALVVGAAFVSRLVAQKGFADGQ